MPLFKIRELRESSDSVLDQQLLLPDLTNHEARPMTAASNKPVHHRTANHRKTQRPWDQPQHDKIRIHAEAEAEHGRCRDGKHEDQGLKSICLLAPVGEGRDRAAEQQA